MALISTCNQKLITKKACPGPLMLKDYLRDDQSSCSSNGFKSFPRRQCCSSTVRFLLEIDVKTRNDQKSCTKRQLLKRSCSKKAASALQRASEKVINAVKLLPFASVKSPSQSVQCKAAKARKARFLPRSFSRKLLKKSFWRKADYCDSNNKDQEHNEIKRWRLFREYLEEKDLPSGQNTINQSNPIKGRVSISVSTSTSNDSDSNTNSNSNSNGYSWGESEFTVEILRSSSGNSEASSENDVVEGKINLPLPSTDEKEVSKSIAVTVGDEEHDIEPPTNAKEWPNQVEKQQFSPVSVLDCPFEDEEDVSSPFSCRLARMEGTKKKLMQKIRRFESLAQLEPVDLQKRIALAELEEVEEEEEEEEEEEDSHESPKRRCSMSIYNNDIFDENGEEEHEAYERARQLFKLVEAKIKLSNFKFKADILFLDLFRENLEEINANASSVTKRIEIEQDLIRTAEDWIYGQPREMILGWEVGEGRRAYVRDMEKNGRWRNLDEEKEEVLLEMEHDILTSLVEEMLLDDFF